VCAHLGDLLEALLRFLLRATEQKGIGKESEEVGSTGRKGDEQPTGQHAAGTHFLVEVTIGVPLEREFAVPADAWTTGKGFR
jgi:hypothetical protein